MSSFYDSVVVVFEMWSSKNEKWDKEKTCDLPEKNPVNWINRRIRIIPSLSPLIHLYCC